MPKDFKISVPILRQFLSPNMFANERFHFFSCLPLIVKALLKRDGTRAETRFGLSAKRTSPFISAGVSVQSSTGFLGVRVGGERL